MPSKKNQANAKINQKNINNGELHNVLLNMMLPAINTIDMLNEIADTQGYRANYSTQKSILYRFLSALQAIRQGESQYGNAISRYQAASQALDRSRTRLVDENETTRQNMEKVISQLGVLTTFEVNVHLRYLRAQAELECIDEMSSQLNALYRDVTGEDFLQSSKQDVKITKAVIQRLQNKLAKESGA